MRVAVAFGKPGRKPHSDITVALVKRLLSAGKSQRRVAAIMHLDGRPISRTSVKQIGNGTHCSPHVSTSRLAPEETRLAEKQVCPGCGKTIDVVPCRICKTLALVEPQRKLQARAAAARADGPLEPRVPRRKRTYDSDPNAHDPLSFELAGEEAERLDQLRRSRGLEK